jgi:hypothetical protein
MCLSAPDRKATSPPVEIRKLSSASLVPKIALSGIDGIQYRSIPDSRIVLIVTMRVPAALA